MENNEYSFGLDLGTESTNESSVDESGIKIKTLEERLAEYGPRGMPFNLNGE